MFAGFCILFIVFMFYDLKHIKHEHQEKYLEGYQEDVQPCPYPREGDNQEPFYNYIQLVEASEGFFL